MAMVSCCLGSTLSRSLRLHPFPVSVPSSHLRTRHSPDRPTIRAAAKPSPCAAVRSGFPFLPASWGMSSNIGGGDANLPFGGGDIGGGGGGGCGGGGSMAGDGAEDDMPIEGFLELDGIVQWLRRLLQHGGASKEHLLADDLLTTMSCLIGIFAKDNVECQPSSGMDAINPVGAEPSSCNGKNDEKHAVISTVLNSTTNSMSSYSYKNTGTETMRKRATNSPIHHVDIGIPDDENDSDENEKKMKMVIKRIKTMFKKATQWLGNLSLPECITAKFKKVRGTQRGQSQPMETV
ncbi:hypothetical protein ZWY2020_017798 [Hordeum vulgare]|nr:hypothetical protein ZWY2020_017798 [Hordeum vulgare]